MLVHPRGILLGPKHPSPACGSNCPLLLVHGLHADCPLVWIHSGPGIMTVVVSTGGLLMALVALSATLLTPAISASACCSTVAVPKFQSANNTVEECTGELQRTLSDRKASLPSCPDPWTPTPSKECCIEVGALNYGECWCLPGMENELGDILEELEVCKIPNAATGANC